MLTKTWKYNSQNEFTGEKLPSFIVQWLKMISNTKDAANSLYCDKKKSWVCSTKIDATCELPFTSHALIN